MPAGIKFALCRMPEGIKFACAGCRKAGASGRSSGIARSRMLMCVGKFRKLFLVDLLRSDFKLLLQFGKEFVEE